MFEWTIPPGFSTGLHVHRVQEETFYVLEGECDWQVGDERVRATPGTYLFLPPGVPHNIANASDKPARVLDDGIAARARALFRGAGRDGGARRRGGSDKIASLRARYDTDQLSALRN